ANPNNPTGTWVTASAVEHFLQHIPKDVWVVLDEAYFEYVDEADYGNGLTLLDKYPNLIVTRTFSKIYGLASARLGFSVSSPEFADLLNRARQPFNVNGLAMAAGLAAIADNDYVERSRALNRSGMQQITDGLSAQGFAYIPSVGNFVAFDSGRPGAEVFEDLLQQGVIVRPIAEYGLPNHVRVSIGTQIENERFLAALSAIGQR
ncbi:MAG: aminotransferase class I/II-fold pyridoxal phosphate-dependent enzyme, partial [Proteobacteria bacterium]|nr:aminotransferase class I/II-fold pyridoxal phosphate-dependent enzyme [Pseudomonadota bacterium]